MSHLWQSKKERLAIGDRSCGNNAPPSRGRVVNGLTARHAKHKSTPTPLARPVHRFAERLTSNTCTTGWSAALACRRQVGAKSPHPTPCILNRHIPSLPPPLRTTQKTRSGCVTMHRFVVVVVVVVVGGGGGVCVSSSFIPTALTGSPVKGRQSCSGINDTNTS